MKLELILLLPFVWTAIFGVPVIEEAGHGSDEKSDYASNHKFKDETQAHSRKKNDPGIENDEEILEFRREGDAYPSSAVAKLLDAFENIGPKSNAAKKALFAIRDKWNTTSTVDRTVVADTLHTAAVQFEPFANAEDNPTQAVAGVLNMVGQFATLFGPHGQMISAALGFISGLLSLFGEGGKQNVGDVVREEIDAALLEFKDRDLKNEENAIIDLYEDSKRYIDYMARLGRNLTIHEITALKNDKPIWRGVTFLDKLMSEIKTLLGENRASDAKRVLRYIEMYTKLFGLRDMIIQQMIALYPEEIRENGNALWYEQEMAHLDQEQDLKFLVDANPESKAAVYYFDPQVYFITYTYLTQVLKLKYDIYLTGTWCLSIPISGNTKPTPITWEDEWSSLMPYDHPYITSGNDGCFWRVLPHGNQLFTIINTRGCPDSVHCGEFMTFDGLSDGSSRLTIEPYDYVFWEITGTDQKRFRNKWGCKSGSSNNDRCNQQIASRVENTLVVFPIFGQLPIDVEVLTFMLTDDNVGYVWYMTKNPMN